MSKVFFPTGVVTVTMLPVLTDVAGFAFADPTTTWPDRHACLALFRVL